MSAELIHAGADLFLNADKSAIVAADAPDASYLLVRSGCVVDSDHQALYAAHFGLASPTDDESAHTVTIGDVPDTPAVADESASATEAVTEPEAEAAPKEAAKPADKSASKPANKQAGKK